MSEEHVEDSWDVDGGRELSDAWTGFTKFIVLVCEHKTCSHCMCRRRHSASASHVMFHAHARLKSISIVCPKHFLIPSLASRHVARPAQYTQHFVIFFTFTLLSPSFTGSGSRLITSRIHWADSRELGGDGFTDPEPRTGYEPKRTVDNPIVTEQEIEHSAEESQIPENFITVFTTNLSL